jgi:hypothetical protein
VEVSQGDKACTGPLLSPSCLYMFQSDIPVGKMMKISVTICHMKMLDIEEPKTVIFLQEKNRCAIHTSQKRP